MPCSLWYTRLQRVVLQYLMAHLCCCNHQAKDKIAVAERDLPCAMAAFDDLSLLLHTLNDLAQTQIHIPAFEVQVFASPEFMDHPLHNGKSVQRLLLWTLRISTLSLIFRYCVECRYSKMICLLHIIRLSFAMLITYTTKPTQESYQHPQCCTGHW